MLNTMGCVTYSERAFYQHQNDFLHPCITDVYKQQQAKLLAEIKKEKRALVIGGDGRADSPGHSAKFGSYTVMELKKKVVIDVQLVQVSPYPINCDVNFNNLFIIE